MNVKPVTTAAPSLQNAVINKSVSFLAVEADGESWGIATLILNLAARTERPTSRSGLFTSRYPFIRRLGATQSQSGYF